MPQREPKRAVRQRAVVQPAMIFKPSGVVRVLVEVLRADVVVLASNHAPKAS